MKKSKMKRKKVYNVSKILKMTKIHWEKENHDKKKKTMSKITFLW